MKDLKYLAIRKDEILVTGVTRVQVKTDSSRKFLTGFAVEFDPKTDTAKYLIGLVSADKTIINRVPIKFFAKDHSKIRKQDLFFPINARANGETLYIEIERQVQGTANAVNSVVALKLDVIFTSSNTENADTYILQHEVLKAE